MFVDEFHRRVEEVETQVPFDCVQIIEHIDKLGMIEPLESEILTDVDPAQKRRRPIRSSVFAA